MCRETPFWRTAAWVVGTSAVVYAGLTVVGVRFLLSHENQIAQTILDQHLGAIVWTYVRILAGYLAAGLVTAFVLHPFVAGWKAAPLALLLGLLGVLQILGNGASSAGCWPGSFSSARASPSVFRS